MPCWKSLQTGKQFRFVASSSRPLALFEQLENSTSDGNSRVTDELGCSTLSWPRRYLWPRPGRVSLPFSGSPPPLLSLVSQPRNRPSHVHHFSRPEKENGKEVGKAQRLVRRAWGEKTHTRSPGRPLRRDNCSSSLPRGPLRSVRSIPLESRSRSP